MILLLVLVLASSLLIMGLAMHLLARHQRDSLALSTHGQVARLLAEAGIDASLRSVREALAGAVAAGGPVRSLLLTAGVPADRSLMSVLPDTWNVELAQFANELDPTATVRVEVWLRGFAATETDPARWADPIAKSGWVSIESTGGYRGVQRTISVRRRLWVASILPPAFARFTLHLREGVGNDPGRFNVVHTDYRGQVVTGPAPLILYHHPLPPATENPGPAEDPMIGRRRGWVYLGPDPVRLHVAAGGPPLGEMHLVHDVPAAGAFQPPRWVTPTSQLPPGFGAGQPVTLQRDDLPIGPDSAARYRLGHSVMVDGFHDRSSRASTAAMYEGNILSDSDRRRFGAAASWLRLFGDGRPGFRSHTRVLGAVEAALPVFGRLEVEAVEEPLRTRQGQLVPPPLYLLPGLSDRLWPATLAGSGNGAGASGSGAGGVGTGGPTFADIAEFHGRRWGGPRLRLPLIYGERRRYQSHMSRIDVVSYDVLYNAMVEVALGIRHRQWPPASDLVLAEPGGELTIAHAGSIRYRGHAIPPDLTPVVAGRVARRFATVESFWRSIDPTGSGRIRCEGVVLIENPTAEPLIVPPPGVPTPAVVEVGGLVLLAHGNVILRGVKVEHAVDALSIWAPAANEVVIDGPDENEVNVVAPLARLRADRDPVAIRGCVALGRLQPADMPQGGRICFRPDQDPSLGDPAAWHRLAMSDHDVVWHE